MFIDNLREEVLINPVKKGADHLKIITGYATPLMAGWHIQRLNDLMLQPVKIDLLVGMTVLDGLHTSIHNGFIEAVKRYNELPGYSNLCCSYAYKGIPVHSKIYIWEKSGQVVDVFIGSANYTQTAFNPKKQLECIERSNDFNRAVMIYEQLERNSIFCTSGELEEFVQLNNNLSQLALAEEISGGNIEKNRVTLSLLSKTGEVGKRSGLNWGQRENREPNQAYIPLPAEISRTGFFPVKQPDETKAPHFTVITDDSKSLVLRVEQENNKAITTPENNSRIGEYFRNRLGLANGAPVTKEDLLRYGRTDVEFIKLDDEQYYMDFSI